MKPEKELIWCFQLSTSQYCGGFFKKAEGGCKKDFERLLNAPENDNDFLNWIKSLIEEGSLEFVGQIQKSNRGRTVPAYVVNFKKLLDRMRRNQFYPLVCDYFEAMSPLGISK
jgi:hypothetical protein